MYEPSTNVTLSKCDKFQSVTNPREETRFQSVPPRRPSRSTLTVGLPELGVGPVGMGSRCEPGRIRGPAGELGTWAGVAREVSVRGKKGEL